MSAITDVTVEATGDKPVPHALSADTGLSGASGDENDDDDQDVGEAAPIGDGKTDSTVLVPTATTE